MIWILLKDMEIGKGSELGSKAVLVWNKGLQRQAVWFRGNARLLAM